MDASVQKTEESESKKSSESEKVKKTPTLKGNIFIILILVIYILFNLLGAYIFLVIEGNGNSDLNQNEVHWFTEVKREFLANHSGLISNKELDLFIEKVLLSINEGANVTGNVTLVPQSPWTLSSAFMLAFTISSTIGYGVLTPITSGGQLFCIVYALLAIPFTGLLAAKMGFVMAFYIQKATTSICDRVPKAKTISILLTSLFGIVIYIIVPSILLFFVGNDEGWTFVQCLYCVIITLTTIGFGDLVPDPGTSGGFLTTILVLVWVVAGLAWFATIVNLVATVMTKQVKSIKKKVKQPALIGQLTERRKGKATKDGKTSSIEGISYNGRPSSVDDDVISNGSDDVGGFSSDVCVQTETAMLGPGGVQTVILSNLDAN